ncbi:hypothetical protein Tco_0230254, partial [Tanacetum coccineum]
MAEKPHNVAYPLSGTKLGTDFLHGGTTPTLLTLYK